MKEFIDRYIKRLKEYDKERDRIEDKINLREKQMERLEKRRHKLECPSWIDELLKPIAEAMLERMPDRYYDILGPFGLDANTGIHFYKKGVTKDNQFDGDNCISITVTPLNLEEGKLAVKDYTVDTHRYRGGTIGELNDFNHPTVPIVPTIDWLMGWMKKQNERKRQDLNG